MDDAPKQNLLNRLTLGPASAIVAAIVGGVFSITAALVPEIFPASNTGPVPTPVAAGSNQPSSPAVSTKPHLTYGTWTLLESKDDCGTDWSNSVLKFTKQQPCDDGLELEGVFEWRTGDKLIGREFVKGNYVESTRNLYIEGQKVESDTGELAVGSFSARLAEDNRHLLDGTWGSTVGNRAGVPGTWRARR
jgi:hypothetical protein